MKRLILVIAIATQVAIAHAQLNSDRYHTITDNGAWCWFSDPRAVSYNGTTYIGWIDSFGSIFVGAIDEKSGCEKSVCVFEHLQEDDHNNPSIYIDKLGYITLFFTKHSGNDGLYKITALEPESIDRWSDVEILELNDKERSSAKLYTGYTYTNATRLSSDSDNLYLFWRGMNFKPTLSISKDGGESWSKGKILFAPRGGDNAGRPYTKVFSDGEDKIHLAVTDGHPRDEKRNSIYYFTLRNDGYYNVRGEKICELDNIVEANIADKVYDGSSSGGKAWIWDVAQDKRGNPVVAFTRYPDDNNHILCYATWSGEEWIVEDLVNSGGWFPQTPDGKEESEPNYSGGITIDKEDTKTVYLSVKRGEVFEIEKWVKGRKGWSVEPITSNSTKDNVRPYAILGAGKRAKGEVVWMQNTYYHKFGSIFYPEGYSDKHFLTSIKVNVE
ncbi:MAG: BNR-4 repeat-containing protein [Rikenellaceae bacterium]